jgi:hypothetical protein
MVGSTLGVYNFGLIFVYARTNKKHHHHHLESRTTYEPGVVVLTHGDRRGARLNVRRLYITSPTPTYYVLDVCRIICHLC